MISLLQPGSNQKYFRYDYNALEPVISAEIMQLHHGKHHAAYVSNLNVAEEKLAEAVAIGDVSTVISLQGAVRFNGGGHLNHAIFWQNLCPGGSGEPTGALADAINRDFGSFDNMKTKLSASTVAVQVINSLTLFNSRVTVTIYSGLWLGLARI